MIIRILFLLIFLFFVSCSRQVKKQVLELAVPGPFIEFGYLSRFQKNLPYKEIFKIERSFAQTRLVRMITNKTITLVMDKDFNMLYTARDSLEVKYNYQIMSYFTNGEYVSGMQIHSRRVVVFPEFQLRDFYYSTNTEFKFVQLLGEGFRVADIRARKLKNITLTRDKKSVKTVPIELMITGVPKSQWRMVYYFDNYGWVIRKEGFFRSDSPNYISELIVQKKDTSL